LEEGDIVIDFEKIENNKEKYKKQFSEGNPFECVEIDNFLTREALVEIDVGKLTTTRSTNQLSSDFIFAKNKIENPRLEDISPQLQILKEELQSDRFQSVLRTIVNKDVFIDPSFTGGGLHQGAKGSYLDMHADFTHHPVEKKWVRELNLLLYLNQEWKPEYGGCLDLKNSHTGEKRSIEPIENRMVIMLTKPHTIHGYRPIQFPDNKMRTSIAAYAYVLNDCTTNIEYASTSWYPDSRFRNLVSKFTNVLVPIKQRIFGSKTAKRAIRKDDF